MAALGYVGVMPARDYFDDFGGAPAGFGLRGLRVGLGDATSSALGQLQGLGNMESYATQAQSAAMVQYGSATSQVQAYTATGQSLLNQAVQVFNNGGPTGAQAASLASTVGMTLLNNASGSLGTIAKIAAGTIAGAAAGFAVGGPIGAVGGTFISFAESALAAISGGTQCVLPCVTPGPGWPGQGTPQGDLLGKNVYCWRQTLGNETSDMPLGYALYLAWCQITPTYGSGVARNGMPALVQTGVNVVGLPGGVTLDPQTGVFAGLTYINMGQSAVDNIAGKPMTAVAEGQTAVPVGCQWQYVPGQGVTCPVYTNSALGFTAGAPVTSGVSTPRGLVGQLIFNSIAAKAGGTDQAMLAITRLPPGSLLDVPMYVQPGVTSVNLGNYTANGTAVPPYSGWQGAGSIPLGYGVGPVGNYAQALMSVLGHLTIGASDQAIASELQAQLGQVQYGATSTLSVQPEHLRLVAFYNTLSTSGVTGGVTSSGASAPAAAAVAVAGTAAAVAASAAVYSYTTGKSAITLARRYFRL